MRIVEADQSRAGFVVQGEAVAEALWALRTGRYLSDDKPDQVFAFCIDRKHLSIEFKQDIEAGITAIHGNSVIT